MKVTSNIIREVNISHLHKTNIENLTQMEAITENPKLYWCKGVLFSVYEFTSEEIVTKQIKGIWYLDSFTYAICQERNEYSTYNGFKVDVIDMTGHTTYENLIESILETEKFLIH